MKLLSNIFLLITLITTCISATIIKDHSLIPVINLYEFSEAYILISIPVLFAGVTVALKVIDKAMTNQSISFMQMMADSKKKEKKSDFP